MLLTRHKRRCNYIYKSIINKRYINNNNNNENILKKTNEYKQFIKEKDYLGIHRLHRKEYNTEYQFMSAANFKAELDRCLNCADAPCNTACPVSCNPRYFIQAAKEGKPSDLQRSAAHIMQMSPFGGVCGVVCPDKFCMDACSRKILDQPIEIPTLQATIIQNSREANLYPQFEKSQVLYKDQKVAIIGSGPSGLAAAAVLVGAGYPVEIFEAKDKAGGLVNTIPKHRLPNEMLQNDLKHALSLGDIKIHYNQYINNPQELLDNEFSAVIVAAGAQNDKSGRFIGEEACIKALEFLWNPKKYDRKMGRHVVVVGGGPVSVDCATTCKSLGVDKVSIFYRRSVIDMPLSEDERRSLVAWDIDVHPRVVVRKVEESHISTGLMITTERVNMKPKAFGGIQDHTQIVIPNSEALWDDVSAVIIAVGNEAHMEIKNNNDSIFYTGDLAHGASNVVEAAGFGKNIGTEVIDYLTAKRKSLEIPKRKDLPKELQTKSFVPASPYNRVPIDLSMNFFDIFTMKNPFILSASPLTDGIDCVRKAYDAGWGGCVLKTAFDDLPIHIPAEYMDWMDEHTGFNADNVSGHYLKRVVEEVRQLVKEYPEHLTIASTGGPVTGDAENDRQGWQKNTKLAESSGAHAVEYSLSCPQGGDGSEGNVVSQSARVSADVVDWIMEVSDPNVPKLFKLTGAVTSIKVIIDAIQEVLNKYPNKKAGITLANSFPTMIFRNFDHPSKLWEEGMIMGMSGKSVLPISYLTLMDATQTGITISGNGGLYSHHDAANFMALGVNAGVQFCTLPYEKGVDVIDHLVSGLSHELQHRGFQSIEELIGCAQPEPVRDFMELSPTKKISNCNKDICISCGNCTHCPYGAISLGDDKLPIINPSKCIGCQYCTLQCPASALSMRDRTKEETDLMLAEHGPNA